MKTPTIDQFLTEYEWDSRSKTWKDVRYLNALATELRALLADRDRLAGEVTEWEGHAQTYEAGMVAARRELAHMTKQAKDAWSVAESYRVKAEATTTTPRRLREYKGVTYRDGSWYFKDLSYAYAASVIAFYFGDFDDADHAELLALRDDPEYPCETLEEIVCDALSYGYRASSRKETPFYTPKHAETFVSRIRAWLATQPQTITPEQAVPERITKALDSLSKAYVYLPNHIDGEFINALNDVRRYILPTATPEVTP